MVRARRASGGREGDLLDRASRLRKTVDELLPKLGPECPTDRFDKLRAALEEVRADRDDRDRLLRRARGWGGEDLAKAYAGLLAFYLEPEMPPLLVAAFPTGEISFAPLSKASREAEVAVQQSDDARRLLLGYLPWARKGFHFFATAHQLYCTGPSAVPPPEFREAKLKDLPYRTIASGDGGALECTHISAGTPGIALEVGWPGAHRRIRICRRCTKDDRHLLGMLTEGLAVPDPEEEFPVSADLRIECRGGDRCVHARLPDPSKRLRQQYLFGKIGDAAFLDEYRKEIAPLLDRADPSVWIAGRVCYGADRAQFIRSLDPTPEERRALEEVLPELRGTFEIEEPSASRALERLWPSYADRIVRAIVPDPTRAANLVKEARANPGRVSDLLGRAARETREREVLTALPTYAELGPEGTFVDAAGRAYRTQGGPGAERVVLAKLPRDGKERGIAWGLLMALGRAEAHRWQFSETERQFGEALAPKARAFLDAAPPQYHSALGDLLGSAGVASWGRLLPPA
jgi:hypothetical protein